MLKVLSVLIFCVLLLTACGNDGAERLEAAAEGGYTAQQIGTGASVFRFEVLSDDEELQVWYVSTNHATVGAALVEVGLIGGDDSPWGLFVTEVAGIYADFDATGLWWAFYVNGEMAMMGVSDTYIEANTVYAFVLTD